MVPKKYGLGSTFCIKRCICDKEMQKSEILDSMTYVDFKAELRMVSGFKGRSPFICKKWSQPIFGMHSSEDLHFPPFTNIPDIPLLSTELLQNRYVCHWFIGVTLEGQAYDPFCSNEPYRHYAFVPFYANRIGGAPWALHKQFS